MKQNVERAGSGRRAAAAWLSAIALLLAAPALAGDRALIDFIGFSPDSRYFAFEEFGVQDGSGFPYSNVYIIDLQQDAWALGTPYSARTDDETAGLATARSEAQEAAEQDLAKLGIDVPVELVAIIGDGEMVEDAQSLRFGAPGYFPGETRGDYELQLETYPAEGVSACTDYMDEAPLAYQLSISRDGGEAELLHRDDTIPASRGCPTGYRIFGAVMPFMDQEHGVALISVYSLGFEGPDRRFLAVPFEF
ncbi:MAG TPA: DUF2259 domain-containing protein [Devosia sp.]|jgi:predicted secreted protein|nr:DUF2259 domain-containing protein [Devosia sp.]